MREAPRSKRMLVIWGRLGSVHIPRLPSRVQGAQPPPGVQRVPLFLKTSEGGAGGGQSVTPRPNGCRGYDRAMTALDWAMTALEPRWIALRNGPIPLSPIPPGRLCPCPGARGKVRKGFPLRPRGKPGGIPTRQVTKQRPHLSGLYTSAGLQGAQPPPGVQGESPCTQKRWRVGRWDNGAGQSRPSAEGGRKPQQIHPPRLCPHHLAKAEQLCYSAPMKWATGPLLFLGACRIHEHWGLTTENPPVAGALREPPQGARPSEEGWDRSQCRCKA